MCRVAEGMQQQDRDCVDLGCLEFMDQPFDFGRFERRNRAVRQDPLRDFESQRPRYQRLMFFKKTLNESGRLMRPIS